jgi:phosphoserine phosphatase RsbU/P
VVTNQQKHKILIAEDNANSVVLLRALLSSEGHDVVATVDGKEAKDALEHCGPFSLIISDHQMPGILGSDFLQIAKILFPKTPRIMMTAFQEHDMKEDSIKKAEVFRFVTKPIMPDDFIEIIRLAIKQYEVNMENLEKEK